MRHLAAQAAPPRSDTAGPIGLLGSPPRGASTASARLDDVTAKLTDAQAELAAAQDKAEASSAEVLTLARKVNEAAEADDRRAAGEGLLAAQGSMERGIAMPAAGLTCGEFSGALDGGRGPSCVASGCGSGQHGGAIRQGRQGETV